MAGTVVFDLDGTLADTSGDLVAAANACFRARGLGDLLDPVADALIAFHGGRAMLRAGYGRMSSDTLLPPGAEDEDFDSLLSHYGAAIAVHTRLYPGVEAALDRLAADGHRLAVCTNKPEALAETLLRELGIRDRFGAMIGADTLPVRKPDPRPYQAAVEGAGGTVAQSFLVGDTETDRKTAAAAGVRVALVSFGPEGEAISRLAPEVLLAHFDQLPAIARDWLG
ncbi:MULTISPECIES: HAD-IA family hydrolase [unclassified Paracoccus (in: a-proteobacteria)]|uniref:HAD-IA family hydrolase n=1 Tax=unclassified Paracoccus (in: a-proteobacteria) TaxID=2688777 RepID=UPI0005E7DC71|nr:MULTISPECIES: HAD-IA family hydrolase [unclassified Paracoccus (in: a-proteobacteria)]KIX19490.1 haloacid dehalogenase [Paracoccus sp. 228]MBF5078673.1 HAD-IA family hydrolase [Paracoccus sp. NBH48]TYP62986.1 phosphoglycolate phosphatase [Stutzerimonas stutzeri]|tara:strand:+ start:4132 stop:4806 length:675 start_codon:yes stop_codon:yes gene_type:complete